MWLVIRKIRFLLATLYNQVNIFLLCRYVVLGEESSLEKEKLFAGRPIWFIYSGMGSQWSTMGRDLLKIDVFRKTFDRCAGALKPYDIDLYRVVTSEDPVILSDIRHNFSAICAIQVALTDVLRTLGISPDKFAGFSMGEVGKWN